MVDEVNVDTEFVKTVLGVRCLSSLKDDLIREATAAGLTVSQYAETILFNRNKGFDEIAQLRQSLVASQKKVEELTRQTGIFRDERLLNLFERVRGREDIVKNAYGDDFRITYNTPADLLIALIYASSLKV